VGNKSKKRDQSRFEDSFENAPVADIGSQNELQLQITLENLKSGFSSR